jgi:hypothetical protein
MGNRRWPLNGSLQWATKECIIESRIKIEHPYSISVDLAKSFGRLRDGAGGYENIGEFRATLSFTIPRRKGTIKSGKEPTDILFILAPII